MPDTHYVFFSCANAAKDATKRNIRAFETMTLAPLDPSAWTYEIRKDGPGIDYALAWAAGKNWIHHVEISKLQRPILVVTCFKEEITEEVPDIFDIKPITPSLWGKKDAHFNDKRVPCKQSLLPRGEGTDASGEPGATKARAERKPASVASGARERSTAISPVKIVWAVCDELAEQGRAAIIAACVEQGVHPSTAATQYAKWKRYKNA
jgi:hypothetical protein